MGRTSDAKKRLIEAGTALMHARGYTAVGVGEICASAGVQKGSFYHFFPSKVDFALSVVDRQAALLEGRLDELLHGGAPPLDRLATYADRARELQAATRQSCGAMLGCPFGNLALEMSTQEPQLRRRVQAVFDNIVDCMAKVVQEAVDQGAVPPQDAMLAGRTILALLEGKVMLAKIHDDPDLIRGSGADIAKLLGAPTQVAATSA